MTLEQFVAAAAEMGVDAVEPTAYYFANTSPIDAAARKARIARAHEKWLESIVRRR